MRSKLFTLENALYLACVAVALTLRVYHLGVPPLTDAEARSALAVLRALTGPADLTLVPQSPAYFTWTYLAFLVFGPSDAWARFGPAVLGSLTVLAPWFFRDWLGRRAAVLTSVLLAVLPGLWQAARTADGAALALLGLLAGLGALREYLRTQDWRWLAAAGALLGSGLASGAAFLTGVATLMLAAVLMGIIYPEEREALKEFGRRMRAPEARSTGLVALAVATLACASTGLVYLRGLGVLAQSWAGWLGGFPPSSASQAPGTLLLFLVAYEPLLLVLGVVGAVRAVLTTQRAGLWLMAWAGASFVFTLVYGARSVSDILWLEVPLAGLAAWVLVDLLDERWAAEEFSLAAIEAGILVALAALATINLAAFAEQVRINDPVSKAQGVDFVNPASPYFFLSVTVLALGLMALITYFFGLGWSPRAAQSGVLLAAAGALVTMAVSSGWGLTQLRANDPTEMWWSTPQRPTASALRLLQKTLVTISNNTVGEPYDLELTVQGDPHGALAWALRNYGHARFVDQLDAGIFTPVVITPDSIADPTLGSTYLGQKFALYHTAALDLSWTEWVGWLAFRRAPMQTESVIVWIRQDVQQLKTVGQTP